MNRCKITGRGGGRIANEFGLCRVRRIPRPSRLALYPGLTLSLRLRFWMAQHRFKLEAQEGNLPGVGRASW